MTDDFSTGEITVGNTTARFQVPTRYIELLEQTEQTSGLNLSYNDSESICTILHGLISNHLKPPTEKQEAFARDIAKKFEIELAEDVLQHASNCNAFLRQFADEFKTYRSGHPDFIVRNIKIVSVVYQVDRWLRVKQAIDSGSTVQSIAESLSLNPETVRSYDVQFGEWAEEAKLDETYDLIMSLVNRHRKGIKLGAFYYEDLF